MLDLKIYFSHKRFLRKVSRGRNPARYASLWKVLWNDLRSLRKVLVSVTSKKVLWRKVLQKVLRKVLRKVFTEGCAEGFVEGFAEGFP